MKSSPKPPTPVDPTKVGQAQEDASINTAIAQNTLNQTGQSGPFGSTNYQQTGTTMVDGHPVPTYTANQTLSPLLQSLLDTGLTGANSAAGANYLSNFGQLQDPNLVNQQTVDALYGQATSRLDPQWAKSSDELANSLKEKGFSEGSDAYNSAMQNFNLAKNDAYNSARNSAIQAGVQDASQLYSDTLAGRQQATTEGLQPLTNLQAIMGLIRGTPQGSAAPTPQANIQTPDILGAYKLNADQQQANYQSALQNQGGFLGGISSLAGSLLPLIL